MSLERIKRALLTQVGTQIVNPKQGVLSEPLRIECGDPQAPSPMQAVRTPVLHAPGGSLGELSLGNLTSPRDNTSMSQCNHAPVLKPELTSPTYRHRAECPTTPEKVCNLKISPEQTEKSDLEPETTQRLPGSL